MVDQKPGARFFSRLAATKRRQQGSAEIELDHRDLLQEDQEFERQNLVAEIAEELRPLSFFIQECMYFSPSAQE